MEYVRDNVFEELSLVLYLAKMEYVDDNSTFVVFEVSIRQHALDGSLPNFAMHLVVQQQLHRPCSCARHHRDE